MTKSCSYSEMRANLAKIWDEIIDNQEIYTISRRGKDEIAVLPAEELSALLECVHLLKSPANAERLLQSLSKVGEEKDAMTLNDLRDKVEL